MRVVILIEGAQGSGKTKLAKLLSAAFVRFVMKNKQPDTPEISVYETNSWETLATVRGRIHAIAEKEGTMQIFNRVHNKPSKGKS